MRPIDLNYRFTRYRLCLVRDNFLLILFYSVNQGSYLILLSIPVLYTVYSNGSYPIPWRGHGAAGAPVLRGGVEHVHPVAVVRRAGRVVATAHRVE